MPESLHRGPRFQPATALPTAPGSRVLMPELLGRVLALARRGVEASQAEVAERYLRGRELTVRVRRAWPGEWRGRV